MGNNDEQVLVVKRSFFDELGSFQGLCAAVDDYLPRFMLKENNFFALRSTAEDDPSLKQIIPYAVFLHGGKILHYTRGSKSGEKRLVAKSSIGIGGHINDTDESLLHLDQSTYHNAVQREIREELRLGGGFAERAVALINDDSTEVGSVHLGVVHLVDLENDDVRAGEKAIAELGFGTHEKALPPEGNRHSFGCDAAIWLNRPGAATRVRSWTPQEGPYIGYLITHNEAISIADYLTLRENGAVTYRPTCHYAYHPCDDAILSLHELQGKAFVHQKKLRLIEEEVVSGGDELGVLLYGHAKGALWHGSLLGIEETRRIAPYQNATGLQVTSAVLAGMIWAIENPKAGIVDADEMDWRRVLEIQRPYLGTMASAYTDWTPLAGRGGLFAEDIDTSDPWQFRNVIVR